MDLSITEENYLKAIYAICESEERSASTNAISSSMQTTAASVTDMIKRLNEKELLHYEKYKGVTLTDKGSLLACSLIRNHRLWETFLVDKLGFSWDEVHDIAEELEHIQSSKLINALDRFLGFPKYDPHGDPIPNNEGVMPERKQWALAKIEVGVEGTVTGVQDHSTAFLQYLNRLNIELGTSMFIKERFEFDKSVAVLIDGNKEQVLSELVCMNLLIQKKEG